MTLEQFEKDMLEASEYFMLQDAGIYIEEYGLKQFLLEVNKFVDNPEQEVNITRILKAI